MTHMSPYGPVRRMDMDEFRKEIEDALEAAGRRKPGDFPDWNVSDMLRMLPEGTRFLITLKGNDRDMDDVKQTSAGIEALKTVVGDALREIQWIVREVDEAGRVSYQLDPKDEEGRSRTMLLKCGPLLSGLDLRFAEQVMPHVHRIEVFLTSEQPDFVYSEINWLQCYIDRFGIDEETLTEWEAKHGVKFKRPHPGSSHRTCPTPAPEPPGSGIEKRRKGHVSRNRTRRKDRML